MFGKSKNAEKHGILKNPGYHSKKRETKEASFDELNVLATYHPPGKDYGLMKIDEPKTPYHSSTPDQSQPVNPDVLAKKLAKAGPSRREYATPLTSGSEVDLTPEEQKRVKRFKDQRKMHYNMKEQLRKGKELAAKELAELDD